MAESTQCFVITGNLTGDGSVVYLTSRDGWAPTLGEAHPFADRDEAERALARVRVQEAVITEPYLFEAQRANGEIRPLSAREILRCQGPSTVLRRPDRTAVPAA